jgi:hypothetical protein
MPKSQTQYDRKAIEEHLRALAERNHGRLTPEAVVAAAKPEDSPLHFWFEWDNRKAAAAHRINQARALIRSVRIKFSVDHRTIKTVAYVRDPTADASDAGYISVARVRDETDLSRDVLLQEFGRAAACLQRARRLAAVFGLTEDVDAFIGDLDLMRTRVVDAPAMTA